MPQPLPLELGDACRWRPVHGTCGWWRSSAAGRGWLILTRCVSCAATVGLRHCSSACKPRLPASVPPVRRTARKSPCLASVPRRRLRQRPRLSPSALRDAARGNLCPVSGPLGFGLLGSRILLPRGPWPQMGVVPKSRSFSGLLLIRDSYSQVADASLTGLRSRSAPQGRCPGKTKHC